MFPCLSFLTLAAAAPCQALVVVPNGYEALEATSAARTPLGWTSSRVQYLVDGSQLCQTLAVITSLRLRLDGGNFNVDAPVAKLFQATIDAYEVPITPDTMNADWLSNLGSATPTNVFNGPLFVPAASRQYPYPNPFSVDIPLTLPLLYQRANGNLLLDITLTGGSGDNWPADGFFFHATEARGEVTRIWEEPNCTTAAGSLSLSVAQIAGNGVVGNVVEVGQSVAPAPGVTIGSVAHVLALDNRQSDGVPLPIDLFSFNAPGCQWNVALQAVQFVAANAPSAVWPVPVNPSVVGVPVFTQALAIESATAFLIPSRNAFQVRIGSVVPPPGPAQMVHRSNYVAQTTGSLSPTGYYGLVMGFVGTFQ